MKHVVVDTGYLLHLFDVDGRTDDARRDRVRGMFLEEARAGSVFYVPVPVIFELCNFISHVANGNSRRRLAEAVRSAVVGSIEGSSPWTITPFEGDDSMRDWSEVLSEALSTFRDEFAQQMIGLTDIAVLRQANALRSIVATRPAPHPPVHIWTVDADLKSREPDREHGGFVG